MQDYGKMGLVSQLNQKGIADVLCTTEYRDGKILFRLEIETLTGDLYHFFQEVTEAMKPTKMEVLEFDNEGGGKWITELGEGYDPGAYPYSSLFTSREGVE